MGGWRVDQTKKIRKRKRGRQEFSMQDYDVQNAGRVMPEDTPVRRGQGAVLNTEGAPEERSTPRNNINNNEKDFGWCVVLLKRHEHSQAPGAYVQACALLPPPSPLFQRKYRAYRHCPRSIPGAIPANFFLGRLWVQRVTACHSLSAFG